MQTLGIILARAGSVGLPNKHLINLLGKPVISYTFEHARASGRLDRVVVSSDCPQILKLARATGLDTILRPGNLATSDASVQDVLLHAMRYVEADESFQSDAIVVLYGNVPVRPVGVIDHAIEALEQTGCDSVRSFCPVGKWHPAWMSTLDGDQVKALRPGSIHRRQDLEPLHLHDGAVVAVSREAMLLGEENPDDPHAFFGSDRRAIQTGMGDTVEIDHHRDLYWAEAILRSRTPALRMVV
jgi:CMP-N-acetylneuraminic acid synthetase